MEKKKSYITFTRDIEGYKWYKPLVVGLLSVIFYLIFSVVLSIIFFIIKANKGENILDVALNLSKGYDSFDVYSFEGALLSLGGIAIMLLALFIASIIIRDRSFSTYGSISGGFNIPLFAKFCLIALIPIGIPVGISTVVYGDYQNAMSFTTAGLIACVILTPLQCIAEEYFFRGFIMQTIGGWFRIPVIAMVLQAVVFASQHPYNIYGVLEVFFVGIIFAVIVYITDGLEAASAAHFINNFTIFFLNGLGFKSIKTDSNLESLIESTVIDLVFLAIVYYLVKKKNFVKRPELVESLSQAQVMPEEVINNENYGG